MEKLKIELPCDPAGPLPGGAREETQSSSWRGACPSAGRDAARRSRGMETAWGSVNGRMGETAAWYRPPGTHAGRSVSSRDTEGALATRSPLDTA